MSNAKPQVADASARHIRGSSLLLFGKVISVGIGLASQVALVRYLDKADFGAWGYAISVIAFFETICTLGLSRSQTRFIPIYHEKGEFDRVFGTIALMLITIVSTSILIIGAVFLAPDVITKLVGGDAQPVTLLFVMIFLVPVEAVDRVFEGLFASFNNARAIFIRKYILSPTFRLVVVLLLIVLEQSVTFVAYGYLGAAILGVLIYFSAFLKMAKREGLIANFRLKHIDIPAREIFTFTLPLMTSDLLSVLMHTSDTLLLGYFHNSEVIASYQAILPTVRVNAMVMTSFSLLFTPMAARLFANNDRDGIDALYWRTAIWLAVLTFPMFVLTFSLAQPLTLLLYGARYSDSAVYLSMLGFAYYFNACLGFNGVTLKVLGKIKYIVFMNIAIGVLNILLNLLLIPRYGALGATVATAASMIVHNCLKQLGLKYLGGLKIFEASYLPIYAMIFGSGVALLLVQSAWQPNMLVMFGAGALASFALIRVSNRILDIQTTFPEVLKLPLMDKLLGVRRPS
jgi:O-antigen/teichoic acid export membrane protein